MHVGPVIEGQSAGAQDWSLRMRSRYPGQARERARAERNGTERKRADGMYADGISGAERKSQRARAQDRDVPV